MLDLRVPAIIEKVSPADRGHYKQVMIHDPCVYCGGLADQVDHIDPWVRGGDHDWTNWAACCRACNMVKRDYSLLGALLKFPLDRQAKLIEAEKTLLRGLGQPIRKREGPRPTVPRHISRTRPGRSQAKPRAA